MKKQENITGVKGNPLSLALPMQKVTFTPEGKVREDYIPAEGSVVEVMLENSSYRFTFNPVVEGNVVHFADKGTLPVGEYDVVILVTEPDGTQRRSKWCNIVQVHDRTEAVLDAFDDFPDFGEVEVLDATIFIFAKGDKGDKGDPGEKGDKGDPGEKGDKGDAGTTDYNLLENKPTRVSQFDNDADYATESFVNSSIATATATYRGSFNLVTDLGLSVGASTADVSTALATSIPDADNNDYCFVQIPVATDTPTVIARIDRYKHNGSGWLYEYTLNNSGFTAEQWDAINSGITSGNVDKLDALPTSAQLTSLLNGKQDTINDLASIRSGASAGATAYQKPQAGIPESDLSQGVKDKINEKEVSNNKVSSWQATPDNTHYPSEKLVKDSLDVKAGIGDVLFANFSNLTPKKTFEYDVSDTAYHPLFSRANTGISQLMSEVDDIVKFRITVTGTNIYARVDVVVRFQPALTYPCIMAWNENFNGSNVYTGIANIRTIYPRALNNGYDWLVEFNSHSVNARHIKVEVFEYTESVTWVETKEDSSYNTATQNHNALDILTNRGLIANQTWRLISGFAGSSNYANYIASYLTSWLGGTMPFAGENFSGNQLAIISGQKMYKATNKNVPINCDCGVFLISNAIIAESTTSYVYIRQKFSWGALTGDPALTMDTFARGDQVYLRCTLGQDGKIYPDGHLSNVKSAGYTWVHIGTAASATAINLDTCGKPFITLNNDGKVTHINGTAVMDSSMSKWGVVSQTQTWTQASDGGYDYTMSDLQYGWIPQANIDLYEAAGAVFNEQSGYFEIADLVDISYQEMLAVYNTFIVTASNSLSATYVPNIKNVRTTLPIRNNGVNQTLSYNFTNANVERVVVIGGIVITNTASAFDGTLRLKKIIGRFDLNATAAMTFVNTKSLEEVEFYHIKASISIDAAPRLSVASILYMINYVNTTSNITITLHPTAYARAIADSDVQAALQAHTNVSLASAT